MRATRIIRTSSICKVTRSRRSEVQHMKTKARVGRRKFIGGMVAFAGAVRAAQQSGNARSASATARSPNIIGFDHVALPMQNTDAMLAFYRALGFQMAENPQAVSVYVGNNQMINFHRPAAWQRETFTLRAPAARPPCGDLCFAWDGTAEALKGM